MSNDTQPPRTPDGSVVVPMRVYKGITVFSTLVATALVVFGFFMFDAATRLDNPIREAAVWAVGLTGWTPAVGTVNVAFGLLGIGVLLLGAGSYVLGTRFKTAEMVESEDSTDSDTTTMDSQEEHNDG
ncbi:DUF7315 family membrane protein [Halapricum hydrolyticum]|uniref:DUF7315 domain-containing protein n=1 Tax=Halapricum hydrolyticum TaxID=2979991 RepID=A0AAE3IAY5_9EURY|nr:hypothetical protein [Halapricum hydrolyticum]MCU4718342.1 hypothetical protein [Halapricum hydrolyticum]MCU4727210.1 hypothetical protein [Halapricum hydrolyticum]